MLSQCKSKSVITQNNNMTNRIIEARWKVDKDIDLFIFIKGKSSIDSH